MRRYRTSGVCVTSYFEGHSATLQQEAVCVTIPAKLHAQFCFRVIAQVFRKRGQWGEAGQGAQGPGQEGAGAGQGVWAMGAPRKGVLWLWRG